MALVRVKVEMEEALREVRGIRDDQLPFAIANSLTQTAKDAQLAVQKELPLRFTIRRLAWMRENIRIVPALKRDAQPWASVEDTGGKTGKLAHEMEMQEAGGEKSPRDVGIKFRSWICVPIVGGAKRSDRAAVKPEDMPGNLMKPGGGGFIRGNVMYKRDDQAHSYMQARGPAAVLAKRGRSKIRPMYVLMAEATIRRRYGFAELVGVVVGEMWPRQFEAAFRYAVKTAR